MPHHRIALVNDALMAAAAGKSGQYTQLRARRQGQGLIRHASGVPGDRGVDDPLMTHHPATSVIELAAGPERQLGVVRSCGTRAAARGCLARQCFPSVTAWGDGPR
jgi:hypothetical protein